jgi:hypothetical protein
VTWAGNFPASMGLVYNGAAFGNTPIGIAATFDSAVYGVGAHSQLFSDFCLSTDSEMLA